MKSMRSSSCKALVVLGVFLGAAPLAGAVEVKIKTGPRHATLPLYRSKLLIERALIDAKETVVDSGESGETRVFTSASEPGPAARLALFNELDEIWGHDIAGNPRVAVSGLALEQNVPTAGAAPAAKDAEAAAGLIPAEQLRTGEGQAQVYDLKDAVGGSLGTVAAPGAGRLEATQAVATSIVSMIEQKMNTLTTSAPPAPGQAAKAQKPDPFEVERKLTIDVERLIQKNGLRHDDIEVRFADGTRTVRFADVIRAVIKVKSNFTNRGLKDGENVNTTSMGYMGISKMLADSFKVKIQDLFNPEINIRIGSKHLSTLISDFSGDLRKALAAYQRGERWVEKRSDNDEFMKDGEVRNFVNGVMRALGIYVPEGSAQTTAQEPALKPVEEAKVKEEPKPAPAAKAPTIDKKQAAELMKEFQPGFFRRYAGIVQDKLHEWVGKVASNFSRFGQAVARMWRMDIARFASRYDVDPDLAQAILFIESGGRKDALSPVGAIGLMQIMPDTASTHCFNDTDKLYEPKANIECGMKNLRHIKRFLTSNFGDLPEEDQTVAMVAAHNAGAGSVQKRIEWSRRKQVPLTILERDVPLVRNYYKVLNVATSASPEEIKAAYKTRLAQFNAADPANAQELKDIKKAFEHLHNMLLRRRHDYELRHGNEPERFVRGVLHVYDSLRKQHGRPQLAINLDKVVQSASASTRDGSVADADSVELEARTGMQVAALESTAPLSN